MTAYSINDKSFLTHHNPKKNSSITNLSWHTRTRRGHKVTEVSSLQAIVLSPILISGFCILKDLTMNVFKVLIVFATRILGQICATTRGYCQKLDRFLYGLLFYALNKKDTRFEWRHWAPIRSWGLITIGAFWLVPLLVLNVCYGITVTGCSSPRERNWLGSFCADPHLNLAAQQPPWYVDLWDAQDNITHNVRLPTQDRNLVIGHHHICDAEHYFSHQLAKINLLPDDLKTIDLHQDMSKLPPGHIISAFCFYLLPSTDMNIFQTGLWRCHQPYAPSYRLSRIRSALKRISKIMRSARSLRPTQCSSVDLTACIYPSGIIGSLQSIRS